jgi:hypothetical protein
MRFTFKLFSFILCVVSVANALHFYLDANQRRCFIEELPTDTVVEGKHFPLHCLAILIASSGHYRAREWSEQQQQYAENPELGIIVEVQVCLLFGLGYQISEIRVGAAIGAYCCQHSRSSGREVHLYLPRGRRPFNLSFNKLHFLV